jgi:hypothetical protein
MEAIAFIPTTLIALLRASIDVCPHVVGRRDD